MGNNVLNPDLINVAVTAETIISLADLIWAKGLICLSTGIAQGGDQESR